MGKIAIRKSWFYIKKGKLTYLYNSANSKIFKLQGNRKFILYLLSRLEKGINDTVLIGLLNKKFPDISKKYINTSIKNLSGINALERKGEREETELPSKYLLGLDRQIEFFNEIFPNEDPYKIQRRFKKFRIALLGLGSISQYIVLALLSSGIGEFKIVDFDKVESRNIGRQPLFKEEDIGKYKTIIVSNFIKRARSNTKVIPINQMLTNEKQVEKVIKDSDLVIQSCDFPRFEIHRIINRACLKLHKPNLVAASRHTGPFSIPYKTSCYGCFELFMKKAFPLYNEIAKHIQNKGFVIFPELGVTPSIAGAIASKEIIAYILGYSVETYNGVIMINPLTLKITRFPVPKDKNCIACSMSHQ